MIWKLALLGIIAKVSLLLFWTYWRTRVSIIPVLVEFEHFANDVANTSGALADQFPSVLVVSDTLPYPPVQLPAAARLHLTAPDIDVPLLERVHRGLTPSSHVLVLPDFVRVSDAGRLAALATAQLSAMVALPVGAVQCERVRLDVRRWTLEYSPAAEGGPCDAVSGRHGLLLPTALLWRLAEPFCRPAPECLYVQTARARLPVVLSPSGLLAPAPVELTQRQRQKLRQYREHRWDALLRLLEVRRVVRAGRSQWHGCTRDSARCFPSLVDDTPDYLHRGRWTPPCCLRHLRHTARHVLRALTVCGARHWLEGGSLLGAVRSGDIIPWDSDVDVGMYLDDVPGCAPLRDAVKRPVVDEQGFVWEKAPEGRFFRVQFSAQNRIHVDIFPFYSRNGTMTKDTWFATHRQDCEFPEHYLTPLETLPFVGVNASVPNRARQFLELKFGPGVVENPQYPQPSVLALRAERPGDVDMNDPWRDEL
ncbi:Fukutin-related protein [Amphibalanus amphitrite]|uniref:Fukutin-related protein n=1 Tax=Amphibalanus amphitrite TaxID=1232801 RepID=A0A6A4X5I2_AMPAM|nr:Fukutin-related protein [Amphibalanus amphitrite]